MQIWIDATMPAAGERFFNVTLLEHLLRTICGFGGQAKELAVAAKLLRGLPEATRALQALAQSKSRPSLIQVELTESGGPERELPERLSSAVVWSRGREPAARRLRRALERARGETLIALAADTVLDSRVVERLAWRDRAGAFIAPEQEGGVALRFDGPLSDACWEKIGDGSLLEVTEESVRGGELSAIPASEFEQWVTGLRRSLAPYALRVTDAASCTRAEDAVFWANYKGSTDFLTRYVFPPFVRWALGPLTRHRVHPNTVTLASIALALAAVPAFALQHWWLGLGMAFLMAALDSVDGKLARITFTSSKKGDVLDHGLDLVHPPFWYMAWGWGAAHGVASDPLFLATCAMFGIYIFDRMLEKLFSAATGKTIAAYAPIDVRMRTFISRRNVNLTLFAAGVALGVPRAAVWTIFGWQIASTLFHVVRLVQCWSVAERRERSRQAVDESITVLEA